MTSSPCPKRTRNGFTLVELLASLALAVFVVAITGQVAVQAIVTRDHVSAQIQTQRRIESAWQWIERDLQSLLPAAASKDGVVRVMGKDPQVIEMTVLSDFDGNGDSLHVVRRPAVVRYRLIDNAPNGMRPARLVREIQDITDPAAGMAMRTIATSMSGFSVTALVDNQWIGEDGPLPHKALAMRAIRISLAWDTDDPPQVRTFTIESGDHAERQ